MVAQSHLRSRDSRWGTFTGSRAARNLQPIERSVMLKSCKPGVVSNFFIFIFILVLCVVPISLSAQNTTFAKRTYIGQSSNRHADLNSDGREDFVYVDAAAGGFFVQLSAGNGVYASPTKYVLPN